MRMTTTLSVMSLCLMAGIACSAAERARSGDLATSPYDPLAVSAATTAPPIDLSVRDPARSREMALRVYLPAANDPAPVVLFSHGLGGARSGSVYLGQHWSARGYAAVFLQPPGSRDAVWKDPPLAQRRAAMNQAASPQNFLLRVQDVRVVLNQLEVWNKEPGHPLAGRLDCQQVGMSGHSFGAITTQAVSGQAIAGGVALFTDRRIKAAIAFSPSGPRRGDPAAAFGSVKIPWLLMTGTKDTAPIGNIDVDSRLSVYPSLPATIDKYELVLHNAEHSVFTDRALPGDSQPRNPNHHRAILALSTAFWDTHLRQDAAARAWLHGPGPRSVLEEPDRWQCQAGRSTKSPGRNPGE
jgi:predicted dienelactone hydrolase